MTTQPTIADKTQSPTAKDDFELSIDNLLAQLALDNYSLVPCQD